MRKKLCAEPPLRPEIRTTSIDYDARREPKTSRFCCKCQRDIRPGSKARRVYLLEDMLAVHPADLESRNPRRNDLGWLLLGMDCAKAIGLEWSVDEVPDATTPEGEAR